MTKTTRKKTKRPATTKKSTKTDRQYSKAAEYVGCLLELHKLQGLLLSRLRKQI